LGHSVDSRDWTEAIAIFQNLGLTEISLLTNNPEKVKAVPENDIACAQVPLTVEPNEFNKKYLETKSQAAWSYARRKVMAGHAPTIEVPQAPHARWPSSLLHGI
jgi:hypothetical protein